MMKKFALVLIVVGTSSLSLAAQTRCYQDIDGQRIIASFATDMKNVVLTVPLLDDAVRNFDGYCIKMEAIEPSYQCMVLISRSHGYGLYYASTGGENVAVSIKPWFFRNQSEQPAVPMICSQE